MSKKKIAPFNVSVNAPAITVSPPNTKSYFNLGYCESEESPIDKFLKNTKDLNILIVQTQIHIPVSLQSVNNNLILLGHISAVESYLREIIRRLILLDKGCKKACAGQKLSYGAALNYDENILPEALLEHSSLAGKSNIEDALRTFLDIKGAFPDELSIRLVDFSKICHLRHCIIHRFGKLGSNNAIQLGFDHHIECLEKPLALTDSHLSETYLICEHLVLVLNNFLFEKILGRTLDDDYKVDWSWDFRKDKKLFAEYYNLFKSTMKLPPEDMGIKNAYFELKRFHRDQAQNR